MNYPPRENRFGSVSVQDNIWPEQKTERQVKKEKEKKRQRKLHQSEYIKNVEDKIQRTQSFKSS